MLRKLLADGKEGQQEEILIGGLIVPHRLSDAGEGKMPAPVCPLSLQSIAGGRLRYYAARSALRTASG